MQTLPEDNFGPVNNCLRDPHLSDRRKPRDPVPGHAGWIQKYSRLGTKNEMRLDIHRVGYNSKQVGLCTLSCPFLTRDRSCRTWFLGELEACANASYSTELDS